jgi:hypothetical protein
MLVLDVTGRTGDRQMQNTWARKAGDLHLYPLGRMTFFEHEILLHRKKKIRLWLQIPEPSGLKAVDGL